MKRQIALSIVGLSLAGCPGVAIAADIITVPTSGSAAIPVHQEQDFDWSGFYAGVFSGLELGDSSGPQAGLGIQAGLNAQFDFFLVGAEVSVLGLPFADAEVGSTASGQILGRAGLIVTDNALIYAAAGYGLDLETPDNSELLAGTGVELAVTDSLSLEVEYLHGFALDGSDDSDQITFGANFHF